jgi:hypothetical protein
MVRVLALCLSLALIVFGTAGVTLGAPHWQIALAFAAGAIGIVLTAILLVTQGRWSVPVAFGMAVGLVVIAVVGLFSGATPWLSWSIFGVGAGFFAIGCARALSPSMYGGELEVIGARRNALRPRRLHTS